MRVDVLMINLLHPSDESYKPYYQDVHTIAHK